MNANERHAGETANGSRARCAEVLGEYWRGRFDRDRHRDRDRGADALLFAFLAVYAVAILLKMGGAA